MIERSASNGSTTADGGTRSARVIAVLGTSFSGSTVLGLVLGAHPRIYAGGELIGLVLHPGKAGAGSCTSCGLDCPYWTAERRAEVTRANVHQLASEAFGRPYVVDTSKSPEWFSETTRNPASSAHIASYVLVIKHPIRYLASCMVNIAPDVTSPARRTWRSRFSRGDLRQERLMSFARGLTEYYDATLGSSPRLFGGSTLHLLHYERLVANPRRALEPLLSTLGLAYEPQMDNFYAADHHQVGGNNGAVYQLKRSWQGSESETPEFRRAFYEGLSGLRIDDKYRQTFSPDDVRWLLAQPEVAGLVERLGYNAADMPYRI